MYNQIEDCKSVWENKPLYIIFAITFSPTSGTEKKSTHKIYAETFSTTPNITSYRSKGKCFLPPEPTHSRSCFCVLPLQYHNRKQKNHFYKTIVAEVHDAKIISLSLVHTESDFLDYLDSLPLDVLTLFVGCITGQSFLLFFYSFSFLTHFFMQFSAENECSPVYIKSSSP